MAGGGAAGSHWDVRCATEGRAVAQRGVAAHGIPNAAVESFFSARRSLEGSTGLAVGDPDTVTGVASAQRTIWRTAFCAGNSLDGPRVPRRSSLGANVDLSPAPY